METVHVVIDRPLGSRHPEHPDLVYPVNYGYIPGLPAGDGEDKWVAAPRGIRFTRAEIKKATDFVERYFESTIELLNAP
ncbi:MAG: hypothetical protein IJ214_00790 [Clostridia bacterium]|nr:hypothetical protein [Clostridia bacterium]